MNKVLGIKVTKEKYWKEPNEAATNETGFSALPGGVRDDEEFYGFWSKSIWWTTSSTYKNRALYRWISYKSGDLNKHAADRGDGLSVRCIKSQN